MLCNRAIASAKAHISDLTFSEVLKYTIGTLTVRVPMFKPFFTRNDDNYRVLLRGRYDPALLLPAKARVNVKPAIVYAPGFKSPAHNDYDPHLT
jgi:hypothetical protein